MSIKNIMLHKLKTLINLKRIKFLTSWLILFIDIVIVTIVMVINFLGFKFIGVKFYDTLPAIYRYCIFLTVVVFYFLRFNTYT